MQSEKPRIQVKTKNLQLIFDYCIETKTEFTVIPRNSADDWEIELNIRSIIEAVRWGMFLKTHKIELIDTSLLINPLSITKTTPIASKTKKEKTNKTNFESLTIQNTNSQQSVLPPANENTTDTIETEESTSDTIFDFTNQNTSGDKLF